MTTIEISRDDWQPFFDQFSREHQGESVNVEVLDDAVGRQAVAQQLPLLGVTADPKNSEGCMIEILAGDHQGQTVNHDIRHPAHVRIAQGDDGSDLAVEITSEDSPTTILTFGDTEWPPQYGA